MPEKSRKKSRSVPRVILAGWGGISITPGPGFKTATVTADKSAYERWGENADSNIRGSLSAETEGAPWEVKFEGIVNGNPTWSAKRLPETRVSQRCSS